MERLTNGDNPDILFSMEKQLLFTLITVYSKSRAAHVNSVEIGCTMNGKAQ